MKKFTLSVMSALAVMGAGLTVTSFVTAPAAVAQSAKSVVDSAISAGRIGETIDGYLAAVSSLSDAERNAMNEINIGRKSAFTKLASKQGVSVEVVARLIGEKQLAKAAAGTKIMTESGVWITK